jgi:ribose 5-phosphate isomerase B|tara:strand:- start:2542 stop:2970 length:429 start_codon:yes stop_codon:yes gene_type:complete
MKIIIGSDHAGYEYKSDLISLLEKKGVNYEDCGCYSADSVDYPDYAHDVSKKVLKNKGSLGVLICGSANGVAMASNKHAGIRAAICWNEKISSLAITHNNANVLCIPARFISKEEQKKILKAFMSSDFQGGRHERRVKKIDQ